MESRQGNGDTNAQSHGAQCVNEGTMALQTSDQLGMVLLTSPLTESNYHTWSAAIQISLEANDKLGFIDGSIEAPTDANEYRKWRKADSTIKVWILSTISKDIVDSFIYCQDSRSLWNEIKERFGTINWLLIYQIFKEISSIKQEGGSITIYYNRLQKCWNELDLLWPLPVAICSGCTETLRERRESDRLYQFLIGLSQDFDDVRWQILYLDPLPRVKKAYWMVLSVERQRAVSMTFPSSNSEVNANRKKGNGKKSDLRCDHCQNSGHTRDTCFKLHGYPEWFKDLKESKKQAGKKNSF